MRCHTGMCLSSHHGFPHAFVVYTQRVFIALHQHVIRSSTYLYIILLQAKEQTFNLLKCSHVHNHSHFHSTWAG